MISILVPCFNEEKSIRTSIHSWLKQTRPADEIIVVDDSSTDGTPAILREFAGKITVVRTPKNFGNKSYAQEFGLQFVHGDVFITTDADTMLDEHFVERIERDFADPAIAAVGGYVKSLQYNWLTQYRAFEYAIGQNLHKVAQSYINFMFVIPGAAGAYRTEVFRTHLAFDHDTLTEDLDCTYKLHKLGYKILYDRQAIAFTQDPASLSSYINQLRRWTGGGWQNLMKHYDIMLRPAQALELSLMYIEGLVSAFLLMIVPLVNIRFTLIFTVPYFLFVLVLSIFAAFKEKRADLVFAPFSHLFLVYVNSYVLIEQFFKEVIFRKKNLIWFTPERTESL